MKNCKNCGAEIDEGSIYCPYCGSRYDEKKKKEKTSGFGNQGGGGSYDPRYGYIPNYSSPFGGPVFEGRSSGIAFLCFCFPLVGLILWYTWRFTKPGKSTSAANGALAAVSFGTPLIGAILWYIWRFTNRERARICSLAAIIGLIFSVVYAIIAYVVLEIYGISLYIF